MVHSSIAHGPWGLGLELGVLVVRVSLCKVSSIGMGKAARILVHSVWGVQKYCILIKQFMPHREELLARSVVTDGAGLAHAAPWFNGSNPKP